MDDSRSRRQTRLICLGLALAVLAAYAPLWHCDFIGYDDPDYVTANPHVQGGLTWEGVLWAFQTVHAGSWHPITWLSHMLDTQVFGNGAAGPHRVNVLLHTANTLLLFLVLRGMTGTCWRSALVAALFALHPLRVESVAWVAERKDVLSGLFFMLALGCYGRFAMRKVLIINTLDAHSAGSKPIAPRFFYWAAFVLFIFGLMSKPMLVTLPFVLLLLDYWPLKRLAALNLRFRLAWKSHEPHERPAGCHGRARGETLMLVGSPRRAGDCPPYHEICGPGTVWPLVREKLPFLAVSALWCLLTFLAQRHSGAVQTLSDCPLDVRLQNVVVSYLCYLGKTCWPVNLATPYPDPHSWSMILFLTASLLLIALTASSLRLGRRFPFVAAGWLWFLGMLTPVIGLVQVGAQAMADRYTYLPLIGLFIILVWGAAEACARWRVPIVVRAAVTALGLIACSARTMDQLRYWRNSETLLSHSLAVTTNNWFAHYNLGFDLDHQGRIDEALPHYREALSIKPYDTDILNSLGYALAAKKQYAEAIPCFQKALAVRPGLSTARYNLAKSLLQMGKPDEAIPHYQAFLHENPGHAAAHQELGVALALTGNPEKAAAEFRTVLRLSPADAQAHFNLGEALALLGRSDEAILHLTEALRLKPDWEEARRELEVIKAEGRTVQPSPAASP